jgi:carboxypeptidase C (cathepsin A)
VRPTAK